MRECCLCVSAPMVASTVVCSDTYSGGSQCPASIFVTLRFQVCACLVPHCSEPPVPCYRVFPMRRDITSPRCRDVAPLWCSLYLFFCISTFSLMSLPFPLRLNIFPRISMFSVASRCFPLCPDVFPSCPDVLPLSSQYSVPSEFPRVPSLDDI